MCLLSPGGQKGRVCWFIATIHLTSIHRLANSVAKVILTSIFRSENMIGPAKKDGGINVVCVSPNILRNQSEKEVDVANYMKDVPAMSPYNSSGKGFHSCSSEAEAEAEVKSNREATLDRALETQPAGIRWMPRLSESFDGIKTLPIGEARLLETGKTKFCNLPVIRIGLRYIPEEGQQDCRTVTVTGLPLPTTLDEVLRSVRGGEVLTATMCNTIAIIGSQTALITFAHSSGAAGFLRIAKRDGFFVGFHRADVKMVELSTYPMRRILQDRVVNRGRTRALTAFNANGCVKKTVHKALTSSPVADYVEGFKDHRNQKEVTVLFYSIEMAMRAFKILYACPGITKIWFGSDPCARKFSNDAGYTP